METSYFVIRPTPLLRCILLGVHNQNEVRRIYVREHTIREFRKKCTLVSLLMSKRRSDRLITKILEGHNQSNRQNIKSCLVCPSLSIHPYQGEESYFLLRENGGQSYHVYLFQKRRRHNRLCKGFGCDHSDESHFMSRRYIREAQLPGGFHNNGIIPLRSEKGLSTSVGRFLLYFVYSLLFHFRVIIVYPHYYLLVNPSIIKRVSFFFHFSFNFRSII